MSMRLRRLRAELNTNGRLVIGRRSGDAANQRADAALVDHSEDMRRCNRLVDEA